MMVGDAAVPVIADTYLKGVRDFDVETAYGAMVAPARATTDSTSPPQRPGYHEYLRYHYIPAEQDRAQPWWVWGPVSTTLEYCVADWATARLAEELGHAGDAELFYRRSTYYRNLFDSTIGFFRPRNKDGSWLDPFDPLATEGSGDWSGSGGPGFVEGNAWHYAWFVPHDVDGLVGLHGGREQFTRRLDTFFRDSLFTVNNEPDLDAPYLFTHLVGEEWRTPRLVSRIMSEAFGTGPAGLPGNDDAGTLSAWFVFSALGFYPDCPASTTYAVGIPLFPRVRLQLDRRYYPGEALDIVRGDAVQEKRTTVLLNGKTLPTLHIPHAALVRGGVLEIAVE
jgi:predicted alpha-1,2-mannosidase